MLYDIYGYKIYLDIVATVTSGNEDVSLLPDLGEKHIHILFIMYIIHSYSRIKNNTNTILQVALICYIHYIPTDLLCNNHLWGQGTILFSRFIICTVRAIFLQQEIYLLP